MSDRLSTQDSKLQVVLVGSKEDAQVIHQCGFRSVHIIDDPSGLYVHDGGEFVLDPQLTIFSSFILALPASAHGLRDSLAVRLGDIRCRWVDWPENCGTATEAARECGIDAVREAVTHAKRMWIDEVCLLSDIPESAEATTYRSGFKLLDDHGFRLVRPAFMPVIGPYGSGKSVLIRQLCCNLLRLHGWRTLITSFEERVKPRYVRDLRRHLIVTERIRQDGEVYEEPVHPSQWSQEQVQAADAQIENGFRFLRRSRNALLDGDRLIDRIEYAVRVYGLEVVVIDPVNEIDHQVGHRESKTDYMGRFIMRLKALADDYDLLMIVCAHPPKEGVEKRQQKGKILTLNDGADTAHYGNKADIGWCVWRPTIADNCPTFLNIDKLKDHDVMGSPTVAKLVLDKGLGRFSVVKTGYDVLEEI